MGHMMGFDLFKCVPIHPPRGGQRKKPKKTKAVTEEPKKSNRKSSILTRDIKMLA